MPSRRTGTESRLTAARIRAASCRRSSSKPTHRSGHGWSRDRTSKYSRQVTDSFSTWPRQLKPKSPAPGVGDSNRNRRRNLRSRNLDFRLAPRSLSALLAACSVTGKRERPQPLPPPVMQPVPPRQSAATGHATSTRFPTRCPSGSRAASAATRRSTPCSGKRYVVLPTAEGYVERGVASWYGPTFHGVRTSMGESYDMYAHDAPPTRRCRCRPTRA